MARKDPDTWMWERAFDLVEKADRMQRQFCQLGRPRTRRATWIPPVDCFETEDRFWVIVALPGVGAASVQILVDDRTLIVTGERSLPIACRRAAVHRMEIPQGLFERRLELPPGRFELVQRDLDDGCLVLCLRKLP